MVPRVIGQTVEAQQKKSGAVGTGGRWDETTFFKELELQVPEAVEPAKAIFEWAKNNTSRIAWGKGKKYGTFSPVVNHKGAEHKPIQVWTSDYLYIQLGDIRNQPPFSHESKRLELLHRLNQIPGVDIPNNAADKFPSIALTAFSSESALKQFLDVLEWVVQEIRAT